jgi:gliding motility-associated-like protein
MKKKLLQLPAFNQCMIKAPSFLPQRLSMLYLTTVFLTALFQLLLVSHTQAQTVTYHFSAATFNATERGYEMPGVGIYFRDNGSSSGNISPNNSANCFGYTPGYPTSSNQFYFYPVISNISRITIRGTGTGSNRVFSSISTSTVKNGTYTVDGGATGSGTISGTTCGSIEIIPSAPISSGLYIRIAISGNINVTSIDFLNNASAPQVVTNTVTNIAYTSATFNGNITSDGGFSQVTRGFVYSTTNNSPTLQDNDGTITDAVQGTGAFFSDITTLTPNTTYYVRAYGTNTIGTAYGAVETFTTKALGPPTVTTTAISNLTSFGVLTGGDVTDDGGVAVTSRGVVWSTSPNPTVPSANATTDGTGAGSFTSQVNGLTASTVYYVRAYAINAQGTAYGNEYTFTTEAPQPSLFTSVPSISFPATTIGANTVLSYVLTGSTLTATGSPVTVTAPAGFLVSTSGTGGFAASVEVPYTGTDFSVTIYVQFLPDAFTSYSGTVTHTGGGATGFYVQNVLVSGNGALPVPPTVSSMGNDFWVGYGFQSLMTGNNNQEMILYLSSNVSDSIIVEIPGLGYREAYWLEANVARETNFMPKFGGTDARLNTTGISAKAIHVYSKTGKTFSLYAHIFAAQSSGATLVLPTNTWGTQYTALTTGGTSNSDYPHSFFFVIANEDNTQIEIVPSADITATATGTTTLYPAGVPFTITLNKGEVFNALGTLFATRSGNDLTGSTVRSLDCSKKISLFTGNGRVQLRVNGCSYTDGGSDNFLQQMFPKVAWGTKYLTTPLKDMEAGFFRVCVQDPATEVKINGTVIDPLNLVNQFFYEIPTDTALLIESDKPVMVAQFCATHRCNNTGLPNFPNTGNFGDPEMIIISPVAQAIKEVTVYSATRYAIVRNYINVIVKKEGVASFLLDGIDVSAQFAVHPQDADYFYASFTDLAGGISHTLSSTETFNAIAYGFTTDNNHESYGYNAGTAVNDLTTPLIIQNPYGGPTQQLSTCRGNAVRFAAVLPYQTNRITYSFGNLPIIPNRDTTIEATSGNLAFDSSFVVNGQTFYVYRLSTPYTFTAIGTYTVQVTSFNPTASDGCLGGSDKTVGYTIEVIEGVTADFLIDYNSCASDTVQLTDQSNGLGYAINQWSWTYNAGSIPLPVPLDTVQSPRLENPDDNTARNYTLRAINELGCFAEITKALPIANIPVATFSPLNDVCSTNPSFALTGGSPATVTGVGTGVYSGPGVSNGNFDAATAGAGTHTITYIYTTTAGCADTVSQNIVVSQSANLTITGVGPLCADANDVTLVPSLAGGVFTGTGVSGNTFSPAAAGAGTFTIGYSIPSNTCTVPGSLQIVVNPVPTGFSAGNDFEVLFGRTATLNGTGPANNTYLWSPASVLSPSSLVTNSTATETTTYTLTATNSFGCTATDEVVLTITRFCVDPPTVFTPNNDGFYDKWVVINGTCTKEVKVEVFNRWGGKVYSNDRYTNNWDGTSNGKTLPDGTYYYIIKAALVNGEALFLRGNVTIMR